MEVTITFKDEGDRMKYMLDVSSYLHTPPALPDLELTITGAIAGIPTRIDTRAKSPFWRYVPGHFERV